MKMLHYNKFNSKHKNDFDPEDEEEIDLFIICMYLTVIGLISGLFLFIYQNL